MKVLPPPPPPKTNHDRRLVNWVFPKNSGFSPKIIDFNRVFHYFHHPFWGNPIFWKHPYGSISYCFSEGDFPACQSLHPWKMNGWNLQPSSMKRKEMIWTKPPRKYVPAVNLPGCSFQVCQLQWRNPSVFPTQISPWKWQGMGSQPSPSLPSYNIGLFLAPKNGST